MECHIVKIAGFGFRKGAELSSLLDALNAAGGARGLEAIATVEGKGSAGCFQALSDRLNVPVFLVAEADLPLAKVQTHSAKSQEMYGTGSLSEAAALLAAGPGARLIAARAISPDTMATCAIAVTEGA